MWNEMLELRTPLLEPITRAVFVYVAVVILIRVAGKRGLAEMSTFDIVVIILLAEVVGNAAIGDDNSLPGGLVGAFTLIALNTAFNHLVHRSSVASHVLQGRPVTVIRDGELVAGALQRLRISPSELDHAIRSQHGDDLSEIDHAQFDAERQAGAHARTRRAVGDEGRHRQVDGRLARAEGHPGRASLIETSGRLQRTDPRCGSSATFRGTGEIFTNDISTGGSTMANSERVALVTGAGNGIGRATAERLLDDHQAVVTVDLDSDGLDWTKGDDRYTMIVGDVSRESTNAEAVSAALDRFGRLDTVVLNAGISWTGELATMPLDEARKIIDVDLWGVIHGTRAAIDALRDTKGSIVITASVSGFGADPAMWAYNTAKGGVVNFVKSAAWDLANHGIRVNGVAPGPIRTALTSYIETDAPDAFEGLRQAVPLGRWGESEEVATVIQFLASPGASFVTGVVVPVDGGVLAGTGQFHPGRALSKSAD